MITDKYYDMQKKLTYPDYKMKKTNPEEFKRLNDIYREENNKIFDLFKKEALEEVGLTNHPQVERLFDFAYREGHSGGFGDIMCELYNIIYIKEILEGKKE